MKKNKAIALMMGFCLVITPFAVYAEEADTESDPASSGVEIDFDEEPYEATLMYHVDNDQRDVQHVEDAFNELTMSELNMHVTLMPTTMSTYNAQVQMILASDDSLDILPLYVSDDINTFIESGFLVDLSDLLETYGQETIDVVGMDDIECDRIGDFLCGIPVMGQRAVSTCFVCRTDIMDEIGWTADDVKTSDDFTALFAAVQEAYPDMTIIGGGSGSQAAYLNLYSECDPLGGATYFGVLDDAGQDSTTVTNYFESDAFLDACQNMRDWYLDGYVDQDLSISNESGSEAIRSGNTFGFFHFYKPNTKEEQEGETGYDITIIPVSEDLLTTSATGGCAYGIAANSKDPEKAMILLNWLFTSPEANNLLNWGVEGVDYEYVDDNIIDYPEGVNLDNVLYHANSGFYQPNQQIAAIWNGNDPDLWERYQEQREEAKESKAYGFYFISTDVLDECSALSAVFDQYIWTIGCGSVDVEETAEAFNDALYAAGLQTVIDAKQEQLDAWLAEQ